MNREIKFRARWITNNRWVYGYYVEVDGVHYIVSYTKIIETTQDADYVFEHCDRYVVDPETVGQYTGLKDKNGKEIYEGDIVKRGEEMPEHYFAKFVVKYETDKASFKMFEINYNAVNNVLVIGEEIPYSCGAKESTRKKEVEIEIIGNIYVDANLLGK